MKKTKRERLTKAGWKVGTAKEFLGLTDEESALIEMKLTLARSLKERRLMLGLTQDQLAKELGSSQSRIAKMEAADVTISMELLVRPLLALGVSRKEVGRIVDKNWQRQPHDAKINESSISLLNLLKKSTGC